MAQLRAIARTLFDHQLDGAPAPAGESRRGAARGPLVAYRAQAEALQGDDPNVDAALDAVRQARGESLRSLRRVDETGAWVVSGAILTEVDRMVAELGGDAPALAVTDREPPWPSPPSKTAKWRRRSAADAGPPGRIPGLSGISCRQLIMSDGKPTPSAPDRWFCERGC